MAIYYKHHEAVAVAECRVRCCRRQDITDIFNHRPLLHADCPLFCVFQIHVLEWERGEFLDRVKLPANVLQPGAEYVFADHATRNTCLLMPIVGADITAGYTHNVLHII